eukprot:129811-Pyramimonas_sp.AAC.2
MASAPERGSACGEPKRSNVRSRRRRGSPAISRRGGLPCPPSGAGVCGARPHTDGIWGPAEGHPRQLYVEGILPAEGGGVAEGVSSGAGAGGGVFVLHLDGHAGARRVGQRGRGVVPAGVQRVAERVAEGNGRLDSGADGGTERVVGPAGGRLSVGGVRAG